MQDRFRVAIVGFGVGGGTTALLLAQQGHRVTLFEQSARVGPVGAGVLLQPSGQLVLKRIGLFDEVVRNAEPIEELWAQTKRGWTLIRLGFGEIEPGCHAYGVHRGDLFEALHGSVIRSGAEILLNQRVARYKTDRDGVWIVNESDPEHKTGPFDFLIVADGAGSRLRDQTGWRTYQFPYNYGALWAIAQNTLVKRHLFQLVEGTNKLLGLLPTGQGRCSLFWGLRNDTWPQVRQRGFAAWREDVIRFSPKAEPCFDQIQDFDQLAFTTYSHVYLTKWHDDRVLFLGDAAHAMSPHLGQGINMALIDASRFAQALESTQNFPKACQLWQQERKSHLRFYGLLSLALTPFFQGNGFIKGWGRDIALPIMTHTPWVRGQMAISMGGLKGGFLKGRLQSNELA